MPAATVTCFLWPRFLPTGARLIAHRLNDFTGLITLPAQDARERSDRVIAARLGGSPDAALIQSVLGMGAS